MNKYNLNDFIKGWVIGNFDPTLFQTNDFEISVRRYNKGDYEDSHMHKISTEYTIIVTGEVEMNDIKYKNDDIIKIAPGEYTDFKCITDVVTCVIKIPCTQNDKYLK